MAAVTAVAVAAAVLASACLPDQLDGRQERADAEPALDVSWFEEASAADALDAGLEAMTQLSSVRLSQAAEIPGDEDGTLEVVRKDLRIATGTGIGDAVDGDCTGTLQLPGWGEPAELLVQDDLGAFRGSVDFWLSFGEGLDESLAAVSSTLADQYADRWTTTPGLATLCELSDFLEPAARARDDSDATKAGLSDVAGVPAGRVVSTSPLLTVTTWIQVAEPHRILRIGLERRRSDGGVPTRTVTTFSEPDAAVTVDFPESEDIVAFALPTADPVTGE